MRRKDDLRLFFSGRICLKFFFIVAKIDTLYISITDERVHVNTIALGKTKSLHTKMMMTMMSRRRDEGRVRGVRRATCSSRPFRSAP